MIHRDRRHSLGNFASITHFLSNTGDDLGGWVSSRVALIGDYHLEPEYACQAMVTGHVSHSKTEDYQLFLVLPASLNARSSIKDVFIKKYFLLFLCLFGLCFFPLKSYSDSEHSASAELISPHGSGMAQANASSIEDNAFSGAKGIVRVNLTAGDGNVQQNSASIAMSERVGVAAVDASQNTDIKGSGFYQVLSAQIGSGAFDGTLGIAMVNQSAGTGNAQFNGVAIAVGDLGAAAIVQLNSESLESYSANTDIASDPANRGDFPLVEASTTLSPDSFQNARGIIMINQTAGNNNAVANSFTLSVTQ